MCLCVLSEMYTSYFKYINHCIGVVIYYVRTYVNHIIDKIMSSIYSNILYLGLKEIF